MTLNTRLADALGAAVTARQSLAGGDVNRAWRVTLDDGRDVFVKTQPGAPPTVFPREADGLAWLAEAGALRVPEVLAVDADFLVLESIASSSPAPDHDARLGRGLAALHRAGASSFGGTHPNFVGRVPQDNTPHDDWATFYRERRLAPLVERAGATLDAPIRARFDRLYERLDALVGPPEAPARLHGDLWSGNAMRDGSGAPVLIDPAVYGGHREVDLAMMRLFGGFGDRVFEAYAEAFPLAPGARARVPLYQLYPLLVHVCMFGRGYVAQLDRALRAALRASA